jgi:hypothetical protein
MTHEELLARAAASRARHDAAMERFINAIGRYVYGRAEVGTTSRERRVEIQNIHWLRTHGWVEFTEQGLRLTRPESAPLVADTVDDKRDLGWINPS